MTERTHILRRLIRAVLLVALNLVVATSCIAPPPSALVDVRASERAAFSTQAPIDRAPSRSCSRQCDNKDPATYLVRVPGDAYYCAADAVTFALLDTSGGSVQLRYSPICRTAWARGSGVTSIFGFSYYSNGAERMRVHADPYTYSRPIWTPMLDTVGLPFKACYFDHGSAEPICTDLLPTTAEPAMSCYKVCDGQAPDTAHYEDANGGLRRCTDARIIYRLTGSYGSYVELRYSRNCRMVWAQGSGNFKVEGFNANGSLRVIFERGGGSQFTWKTLAVNDAGLTARACIFTDSAGWRCTQKY